jgi:REP element-mobilizing transposase RayT
MSQSLAKILVHIIYSTKHRQALLPATFYEDLKKHTFGICQEQKCHLIAMNNVSDHVHLLVDLHRTEALADLVMHIKKGSSRWLKEQGPQFREFEWQNGYGAFSLGVSQRAAVLKYIGNQQAHHVQVGFQAEFRSFLNRYEIEYDERYVWD